jgi:hypothetical protein
MPVETEEDLLIFLNPDEFGVEAQYQSREEGAEPKTIPGQFDNKGSNWNPNRWTGTQYQQQMGASVTSSGPTFQCRTIDVYKGGRRNETFVISGSKYRVDDKRPDGTGMTIFLLTAID